MGVMQMYVPMPTEEIYRTLGPVRKKLSRILLYIVQSFTDRDMDIETYTECHKIIGAAWRRMNEDLEFCEQLELELPRSREWHRDREWGSVHDETYFTKEALLKAVKSFNGTPQYVEHVGTEYEKYDSFLNYEITLPFTP